VYYTVNNEYFLLKLDLHIALPFLISSAQKTTHFNQKQNIYTQNMKNSFFTREQP